MTKERQEYTGAAADFCTITVSNVKRVPVGSKFRYGQAAGVPDGLLDSNVTLDAGNLNRALGRCNLDIATQLGLCTFCDGTGELAGFQARIEVSCPGDGIVCDLVGAYSFNRDED